MQVSEALSPSRAAQPSSCTLVLRCLLWVGLGPAGVSSIDLTAIISLTDVVVESDKNDIQLYL